ncbi:beta-propeller domain-containing protein [Botrimarina mediterranea]|uniref:beta-propeller domain-containing protein n=1 Tax=Botrimarina mediterranea TaxID=2528022 RepID=UPI003AF31FCF
MMSADGLGATPVADELVQTPAPAAATFASLDDLRQWITEQATAQYGELFGSTLERPPYYFNDNDGGFVNFDGITIEATVLRDAMTLMAVADQTNVQVEGVDEADLVETDGEFLYMVAGSELVIIDIRDPENLSVASRVQLGETPAGIYLTGDRLTLVSTGASGSPGLSSLRWSTHSYGYNTGKPTVTVTVLDVSDREAPTQVEQTEIDGSLVSSRMVDGELRLVTQQSGGGYLPPPRYSAPAIQLVTAIDVIGVDFATELEPATVAIQPMRVIDGLFVIDDWRPQAMTYQYESLEEYVDRVLAEWTPTYRTLSVDGEVISEGLLVDPMDIEIPADPFKLNGTSRWRVRTTISTFDVLDDAEGPSDTETIRTSGATTVYADGDNLYVFEKMPTHNSNGIWATGAYFPPATQVTKFSFGDDGAIHEDATGTFSGTLLNQFAVDEYDGYLRVVTTSNGSEGQALSILQQQGDELVVVGSVSGLAPGEELHSVRFVGETAYVVTFRVVDPLFTIDLSDPTAPVVEGELKIPGYSDYLHPIGEGYLLGIGRGADIHSGYYEEMQVSIFDVTDLTDPTLLHRYSIDGGRNTTSTVTGHQGIEGDGDHHATAYYADAGVLTLPIEGQYSWGGTEALYEPGEGGLLVLSVDVADGIEKLALIEHESPILRSVRVGDTLIAISATQVSSHQLTSPADSIDTIDLPTGEAGLAVLTEFLAEQEAANSMREMPQRVARERYVPAMRGAVSPSQDVAATPRPGGREIYAPAMRPPEPSIRTEIQRDPLRLSPAASDEALLLLASGVVSDADETPFNPAVCFEAGVEETSQTTESGVRHSWRPSVRS